MSPGTLNPTMNLSGHSRPCQIGLNIAECHKFNSKRFQKSAEGHFPFKSCIIIKALPAETQETLEKCQW